MFFRTRFSEFPHARRTFFKLEAGLIAFGIIGVWLLAKAVNRDFTSCVHRQGRRRLGFDDEASPEKMRPFCRRSPYSPVPSPAPCLNHCLNDLCNPATICIDSAAEIQRKV